MDGYTLLERIGSGAYSPVFKAVEKGSGALVAVKELLSATSWAEAQALPEVVAARALPAYAHPYRAEGVTVRVWRTVRDGVTEGEGDVDALPLRVGGGEALVVRKLY